MADRQQARALKLAHDIHARLGADPTAAPRAAAALFMNVAPAGRTEADAIRYLRSITCTTNRLSLIVVMVVVVMLRMLVR